jgi:hypothetical protein
MAIPNSISNALIDSGVRGGLIMPAMLSQQKAQNQKNWSRAGQMV